MIILLTLAFWLCVYLYIGWRFSRGLERRWFWVLFWGFSGIMLRFSAWLSEMTEPIEEKLDEEERKKREVDSLFRSYLV